MNSIIVAFMMGILTLPQTPAKCDTLTVCQRCYQELIVAPARLVFLYVPSVRGSILGGFDPFTLSVLEGVYGRPFQQSKGSLVDKRVDSIGKSQHVKATSLAVNRKHYKSKKLPFRTSKGSFSLEVLQVNTSWNNVSVTVSVCDRKR